MFRPELDFNECLAHVSAGDEFQHVAVTHEEIDLQRNAVFHLATFLKAGTTANPSWMCRGEVLPLGFTRPLEPGQSAPWEKRNWVFYIDPDNGYDPLRDFYNRLLLDARGRLYGFLYHRHLDGVKLQVPDVKESVRLAVLELCLNHVENGKPSYFGSIPPQEVWISRNGILVRTLQSNLVDLSALYDERMKRTPDRDPDGNLINLPRYWYDFGNGAGGYIRGNGLSNFAQNPDIKVCCQATPEAPKVQSVVLFSDQHLSV